MLSPIMGRLIMRYVFSLAPENVQSMWRHYKGNGLVCQLPYICLNDAAIQTVAIPHQTDYQEVS